jgi:hypothetical protein
LDRLAALKPAAVGRAFAPGNLLPIFCPEQADTVESSPLLQRKKAAVGTPCHSRFARILGDNSGQQLSPLDVNEPHLTPVELVDGHKARVRAPGQADRNVRQFDLELEGEDSPRGGRIAGDGCGAEC